MPTDAERLAACDAEVASHRAKFPDVAHIEPETLRQMQSDGPVLLVENSYCDAVQLKLTQ